MDLDFLDKEKQRITLDRADLLETKSKISLEQSSLHWIECRRDEHWIKVN
jgi:hypothetical protein